MTYGVVFIKKMKLEGKIRGR